MNAENLRKLHDAYRAAVSAARDEGASEEARKAAAEDLIVKRHALDEALVQAQEEREDERRAEMVEAREKAQREVAAVDVPKTPRGALPVEEVRAFAEGKLPYLNLSIPYPEKRTEYDVSTAASGAYGSYLIPQTWADYVVTSEVAQSGVLKAGPTILRTAGGGQINIPYLSTDIAAAAGTEGSDATQDTPVFGTVPLNSYRIDGYVNITEELLRDSGVDLNEYLGRIAGRALGYKMAAYLGDIDIGSGSLAPAAITVGATSAVTAAGQDTVTMDELKELFYDVLPQYRSNGSFIANSDITQELAMMKDDTGNYLWQPSNMASEPDKLWGRPWYEDAQFDASSTGNIPVVFGDVKAAYVVRLVGAIDISFSREAGFKSFEVVMRYGQWFDAATVDATAVKCITLA